MATISMEQIKEAVGSLYLENMALQAELKAAREKPPQAPVVAVPDAYPDAAISGRDDITGHKRPPLRDINSA